jgi:hypothetical protein
LKSQILRDASIAGPFYLRRRARIIKAMPKIISGDDTQNVPEFATLFRFRIASTAAATRRMIPIKRIVVGDKVSISFGYLT